LVQLKDELKFQFDIVARKQDETWCLAIPGKVVDRISEDRARSLWWMFLGLRRKVDLGCC